MEAEKLKKLTVETPPELAELLAGNPADIASETAAALGCGYQIGKLTIPPLTLGVLPLLEAIDSPLVDDAAVEEMRLSDIMRSIYVMARGFSACAPIMAMYRRKAALHSERERATQNPELFRIYLEQKDRLEQNWIVFDKAVTEFWDNEVGAETSVQLAAEVMSRALKDAISGLSAIPKTEKKTPGNI